MFYVIIKEKRKEDDIRLNFKYHTLDEAIMFIETIYKFLNKNHFISLIETEEEV